MTDERRYIWENCPAWVNFLAQDVDNEIWGYAKEPVINKEIGQWVSANIPDKDFRAVLISHDDAKVNNWETSLEKRAI